MKNLLVLLANLACAVILSSCISTKDILIDSQESQTDKTLAEIETAIVPLEAVGPAQARSRSGDLTKARQLLVNTEKEYSVDKDFNGKLAAWQGRLAILEGRYSDAVRFHRQSSAASPGNIPSVVLGIRLEGDPLKRLEMIEKELAILGPRASGIGEINIERGRTFYELNRFSEAVSAFDIAFSSGIDKIYNDSYVSIRDRAWELRNTSNIDASSLGLLGRETITWNDCITLAKNNTQLLRFITGGRNISDSELFSRLLDRAIIPYLQNVTETQWPSVKPSANEIVTRAGAAWLIWHLYAETRADRGLLTRYSTRYATGSNPRSPITDVPPLSPFFDSILGCVETEFLSLVDGRNFRPSQPMRGAELLSILQRIDN
ncbi:MAG: S-layer homology domain-containing protein [Treponema sp.]|nr:S-layer homology domain-containing protein [Treponema sp.]MCL2250503.1 S-layer homology domain-containing protein [Treponema sp.]